MTRISRIKNRWKNATVSQKLIREIRVIRDSRQKASRQVGIAQKVFEIKPLRILCRLKACPDHAQCVAGVSGQVLRSDF
jgi:hypothetical protein